MSTRDREQTESTEQPDTTEQKAGHIADTTRERQWCWCEVRQGDNPVLADEHYWNSTTAAEKTEDTDERMLQIVHWEQEADEQ